MNAQGDRRVLLPRGEYTNQGLSVMRGWETVWGCQAGQMLESLQTLLIFWTLFKFKKKKKWKGFK